MGRPRELTQEERERLRRQGFRPVEVWVPDFENKAYRAEALRQSQSAAAVDAEDDVMEWIEAVSAEALDDV